MNIFYVPLDPQKLSLEADPLSKWGSASRIHQHTAPSNGVRLQNSSTYSPLKGDPPLDFINQKGVCLQILSTKKGSHQPKGQFLWMKFPKRTFGTQFISECKYLFSTNSQTTWTDIKYDNQGRTKWRNPRLALYDMYP